MSFSTEVKQELCKASLHKKSCAQAEAYGVLLFCAFFESHLIRITTASEAVARRLPKLFQKAFSLEFDHIVPMGARYSLEIHRADKIAAIATTFGTDIGENWCLHLNFAPLEEDACRQAFFRGAFLAGGSVTDPAKGYHLELLTTHYYVSRELPALLHESGFAGRNSTRRGNFVTYFKNSGVIEDFLTLMGAPICAMEIMNAKVEKNLRTSVNRRVNCDAANLDKTVEAAQVQIRAISALKKEGRLESLPPQLQQTARLRLEYPELTLSQLAQLSNPPMSKSALNHRLRKIVEEAYP